jgi:hypothetical protein
MVPPEAARNLEQALADMRWEVLEGRFCLLGFDQPASPEDLCLLVEDPTQLIREGGETSLLVRAARADEVLARHPGARVERDLAWIRFETAMAWDLVGFLALVTGRLAQAGVPVGAVCGFSRDSLFVAEAHLAPAREVLLDLFGEAVGTDTG